MMARPPCLSSETEFKSLPLRFSCMNIARSKANQLEKCLLNVYEFFMNGRNPERNYAYLYPVLWPSTKKRIWSKEHILEVLFKFLFSIDLKS